MVVLVTVEAGPLPYAVVVTVLTDAGAGTD